MHIRRYVQLMLFRGSDGYPCTLLVLIHCGGRLHPWFEMEINPACQGLRTRGTRFPHWMTSKELDYGCIGVTARWAEVIRKRGREKRDGG